MCFISMHSFDKVYKLIESFLKTSNHFRIHYNFCKIMVALSINACVEMEAFMPISMRSSPFILLTL